MHASTRRDFMLTAATGAAGLAIWPLAGCAAPPPSGEEPFPEGITPYPLVEVEGNYYEIGRALGAAMKPRIRDYFAFSRDYPQVIAFLQTREGSLQLQRMLGHVRTRFPHLLEELLGMAETLDIPFLNLFAYNCRSEINVLEKADGCSTLAYCEQGKWLLAHNEDGDDQNQDRMFVVRVRPEGGTPFVSLVYPGLLPGNGPGFNGRGVVQTTNYIQPRNPADGIPRYFISRAVMEAHDLDHAVKLATTSPRAYPWHHNLASFREGRVLSLETVPGRYHLKEVRGFSYHTNHLLHPEMKGEGGALLDIPYESSLTRFRVLAEKMDQCGTPSTAAEMMALLTLHEGRPYSPCRHPEGKVHGATLGTALFEGSAMGMTLYHGNPCRSAKKVYTIEGCEGA